MDYRAEILRMLETIQSQTAMKKIYKFVRMIYGGLEKRAGRGEK